MKLLESSEKRYDAGINLLTFGNERKVKGEIASRFISENDRILEIGVGTGTLAILSAEYGAYVMGIDFSKKMLGVAEKKIKEAGLSEKIRLKEMGVAEMDTHLADSSFDKVIGTFVFSELSELEQHFALRESYRVLKPDGKIIILDEIVPRSLTKRIIYYIIRIPLTLFTYLFVRTTTKPLRNIEYKLVETQFRIETNSQYFLNSMQLVVASKI
jgi:ubiquinone/menaquinone biosynthesis C-methylase UbiE